MSRFYRALQEASRSVPELAEKPTADTVFSIESGIDAPDPGIPAQSLEPAAPVQPKAATRENENKPASIVEPSIPPEASSRNGLPGIAAHAQIDRTAPLIPNTIDSAVIESYRRLRAKLMQEQERKPFRSLIITSPAPEDGKTVTAMNLALSFAALPEYRVLLVDGDMRRGKLGQSLGVGEKPGLGNLIEGSAELEDVVLKCDDIPVYFMVRGSASIPPAELFHSPRLIPQLRKMTEHFSLVLIDSPPVNLVADTQLLAAGSDAVLVVARAFSSTRQSLQKAVQDLSHCRVIGTVLNRGMRTEAYRHYKKYY